MVPSCTTSDEIYKIEHCRSLPIFHENPGNLSS